VFNGLFAVSKEHANDKNSAGNGHNGPQAFSNFFTIDKSFALTVVTPELAKNCQCDEEDPQRH
jgi:hypothetical protein